MPIITFFGERRQGMKGETLEQVFHDGADQKWIRDLEQVAHRYPAEVIAVCLDCGITVKQLECHHKWKTRPEIGSDGMPSSSNVCARCGLTEHAFRRLHPSSAVEKLIRLLLFLLIVVAFIASLHYC